MSVLFVEKQYFKKTWWFAIATIVFIIFILYAINMQVFKGQPFGNKPMTDFGLYNTLIGGIFISTILFIFRLDTMINKDGIYVRFFPIHLKYRFYPWCKIKEAYIRDYSPIQEYGGWGFRGFYKNRALNVSGNHGLQIVFKDGRKLLIGTRMPEEIEKVIQIYIKPEAIQ